jgi:hypothetical protein
MMHRGLSGRLSALGLIFLFQAGVYTHLEHVLCLPDGGTAEPTSDLSAAPVGGHMHHGQAAGEAGANGGSEHQDAPSHEGPCSYCCPHGPAGITLPAAYSPEPAAMASDARPSAPDQPRVGRTPHLLPFPNPPPTT